MEDYMESNDSDKSEKKISSSRFLFWLRKDAKYFSNNQAKFYFIYLFFEKLDIFFFLVQTLWKNFFLSNYSRGDFFFFFY